MLYTPHPYQNRAFDWCMDLPFSALWMEMGLGKTVVTLTVLHELMDTLATRKILLVAPLRVANSTWPDEIAKWGHTRDLPFSVVTGTAKQREAALKSKAPLHIINYDNTAWLVRYVLSETGGRWPYDTIVLDESSWVKNQSSTRYRAINHIRPALDRMIQLTGSPAGNGLLDLWAQLYLLDEGARLGNTYKAMRDRWFEPVASEGEYGPMWVPRPGASGQIHRKVSDIAMSLRARDYLDMPDKIVVPVRFKLPPKLQQDYDHLEAKMWLELGDKNIEAVNSGALTQKCRQYANGFLYDEDKVVHQVHDLKLRALGDVVAEAEGQPLLVGYQYIEDRDAILKRFPQARQLSTDPAMIDDWNAGRIPIMLAHPKSAGHGLNLQSGGHLIALYGMDWSLELYEQMVARLDRQGQQFPVIVYQLTAEDTIDELMLLRIASKDRTQAALKSAVHIYQQTRYGRK